MRKKDLIKRALLFVMTVTVIFSLSSCGSDEPDELEVSPTSFSLPSTANAQGMFSITSNTDWMITPNQGWIHLSTTSGNGNTSVIVTADENKNRDNRIAILTVSAGALQRSITVTQEGLQPDLNGTTWVYQDYYSDGTTLTQTIKFTSKSSAQLVISVQQGTNETKTTYDYDWTCDNEVTLVVLKPRQAGNATLEGRIENFLKMTVINTSNNSEVGVFYKQ